MAWRRDARTVPSARTEPVRDQPIHHAVPYDGHGAVRCGLVDEELCRSHGAIPRRCHTLFAGRPTTKPRRARQHTPDVGTEPDLGVKGGRQVRLSEQAVRDDRGGRCQEVSRVDRPTEGTGDDERGGPHSLLEVTAWMTCWIERGVLLAAAPAGKFAACYWCPVVPGRPAVAGQDNGAHAGAIFVRCRRPRSLNASHPSTTAGTNTTMSS